MYAAYTAPRLTPGGNMDFVEVSIGRFNMWAQQKEGGATLSALGTGRPLR